MRQAALPIGKSRAELLQYSPYFLQHVEKLQDTELHTQSCFLYMPCQKGDTHLTARPTGLQPDNRHSMCAAVTTSLLNSHPMRPFITDVVH